MHVALSKSLFAWETLEDSPSLKTIRAFLEAVPDGRLLAALRQYRGHGRNDHPVHVLWGVVLLTVLLRHTSFAATLGELRRNEALRLLIGIKSEQEVPDAWNVSRFLRVLGLPQPPAVQRWEEVWQDRASQERAGPAAVPADPACDEALRAPLQGADRGGACERPAEGLLGSGRREHHWCGAVPRAGWGGDGGAHWPGDAAGEGIEAAGHTRDHAPEGCCRGPSGRAAGGLRRLSTRLAGVQK